MWTPNTGTGQRVLAPLLLAAMSAHVFAHPSAIGGGRGSCGAEYDTPDKAYYLPDISESWYLRRIATCDKPVFWQRFGARFCPSRSLLCCARPGQTSAAMTVRAKQRAPGKEELCRPPPPPPSPSSHGKTARVGRRGTRARMDAPGAQKKPGAGFWWM